MFADQAVAQPDGARYYAEVAARHRTVKVGPGGLYVTDNPSVIITTVLGSCVSACIRDPVAGVGGLNHFMLPDSVNGAWDEPSGSLRFGNFAMQRLTEDILKRGGRRNRFEVKLFGGAQLGADTTRIGHRNADFVEAWLKAEQLGAVVSELRGSRARQVAYMAVSGRAFMRQLKDHRDSSLAARLVFARTGRN